MKYKSRSIIIALGIVLLTVSFPKTIFAAGEFITTWKTDNPGSDPSDTITIPTTGGSYNYTVDWGQSIGGVEQIDTGVTGNITHTYLAPGTYIVTITGTFPRIYFNGGSTGTGDAQKILSVAQWGNNHWTSMANAFTGCFNLGAPGAPEASDTPDLSGVTDMSGMFGAAHTFNQDISGWDVSHVTNMHGMFGGAVAFNQSLSNWDTSNVTDMGGMFVNTTAFNQPLVSTAGHWNTSKVTTMSAMLAGARSFNQDISSWDVSKAVNMTNMLNGAVAYNNGGQPLNPWTINTSQNVDMSGIFTADPLFNQDVSSWNVSHVIGMSGMFNGDTAFNQNVSSWDVSHTTNMSNMFKNAVSFNNLGQPLSWGSKTASVTTMNGMFSGATAFNQDISGWNVANVIDTGSMFAGATAYTNLGQSLNSWNMGLNNNMNSMFAGATAFNQDISGWNTSHVGDMTTMFDGDTVFNQNLSAWNVATVRTGGVGNMTNIFRNTSLSLKNYDAILAAWSGQVLQSGVSLGAGSTHYCMSDPQRTSMINTYGWTFTDGGIQCSTLTYTANTGGSITGTTTQHVGLGEDGTLVTAVPASGYSFASWSDNVTQATRTDTNVSGNIAVTASFTANPVVVTPSGGHTVGECATGTHLVNIGSTWQCVPDTTPTVTPTPVVSTSPSTPTSPAPTTPTTTTPTATPIDTNNNPGTINLSESCDGDTLVDTAHTGANFLACVKILQTTLNTILGSKLATPLLVDGVYGPKTTDAIKLFQKQAKLAVDGAVGQTTSDALNTSAGTTLGTTFMSSVKALQSAFKTILGLKIPSGLTTNGVFGEHTIHTVKVFQDQVKLIVDGRFGPMTSGVLDKTHK